MPRLLINKQTCLANLERMATKAKRHGLSLRPHFKTHQNDEVGSWYRDFGIESITVSSFAMARQFARTGWEDILVAFPFIPGEIKVLDELSEKCRMSVLVDHPVQVEALGAAGHQADFYIDIDTGYGRTGVIAAEQETISDLINSSQKFPRLQFRGFYCHAGHSYKASGQEERKAIHFKAMKDLAMLKQEFAEHDPMVLYGDTPSCSTMENFGDTDVLTPGNFIFYDLFQQSIASCRLEDIAVSMECPVAGIYPQREQVLIHGGAVHFSKEGLTVDGRKIYGQTVKFKGAWLESLSQEHGILSATPAMKEKLRPGDRMSILPVHSCLTVNLMKDHIHLI